MSIHPRRLLALPAALVITTALLAQPAERPKAEAMVKEGIAFLKANGKEAFLAEVHKPQGRFHVKQGGTLYLFVYDLKGVVLAHGARANLLGVNRWNVKDPDGVYNIQEIIKTGQKKGGGWADMKVENPATGKVENKTSFCLAEGGIVVGCGIYK
ncbi:cache domain-containing protein [Geothrix sp.]|jgi:signal transduction histidine kinase|uniref:cache domain-containing protein n=1 Tax=Geothrix sp. TaxID=1962974 RepID=UPI0025B80FCD|nr:cache domain-containing protein [Geothrix sp.]